MKKQILRIIKYAAYCLGLFILGGITFYLVAANNVAERVNKRYHFQAPSWHLNLQLRLFKEAVI